MDGDGFYSSLGRGHDYMELAHHTEREHHGTHLGPNDSSQRDQHEVLTPPNLSHTENLTKSTT